MANPVGAARLFTEGGADTVMVKERPVLFVAMWAYVLSFGLTAVSRGRLAVPGYDCAYYTLTSSLVVPSSLSEGEMAENIALLISGWINIAFLASLTIRWRSGSGRAFRILRTTTLLMIPFCWIVFYHERLYPREGHVLWVASMVLALFADSPTSSPEVPAASTS